MRIGFSRCCGAVMSLIMCSVMAVPSHAAIDIDLSYVNQSSPQFQRFRNWVDEAVAGQPGYEFSATDAAYMYRLTGQSQYAQLAVSMVDTQVSEAEAAIASGGVPDVAGDSYLYVGGMIGDLAITYDWCSTYVTSSQRTRWSNYAEQAIFNVWNPSQASWGGHSYPWSGWSIDNPANNYFYSFMKATMYWALASNSSTWTQFLDTQKIPLLQNFYGDFVGGGSQEGTGYGLSHQTLFELYRVWRDSTGTDLANANAHLTDSIYWWIHATVPTMDRVAPIGDQARVSVPVIYDYHRHLMLEAHRLTNDAAAQDAASWWLHSISVQEMESGFNFRNDLLPAGNSGSPPADLVYHAPTTGQLFARTSWDPGAMWMQFTAGPYMESHAHQDQGSFTLFAGDWLAVTENIWSHSGIQQGTDVHNMLRFVHNGSIVPQQTGTVSTMTVTPGAGGSVHAVANLTPAYGGNAAVQSWQRTIDFANRTLTVTDDYAVGSNTQAIFQIDTPVQPVINGQNVTAGTLQVQVLSPANATIQAVYFPSLDSDFNSGWRLDISGGSGHYEVELGFADEVFQGGFDN